MFTGLMVKTNGCGSVIIIMDQQAMVVLFCFFLQS